MMHTTKIIETRQVADELHAVCIQCCDDEKHISWHTMHASVINDARRLADSLAWAHNRVAGVHEASIQANSTLKQLLGQKVQH